MELMAFLYIVIGVGCWIWLFLYVPPHPDEVAIQGAGMRYPVLLLMMMALWPIVMIPYIIIFIRQRDRG